MKKLYDLFDGDDVFAFISTVILMIITHGFAFTNIMYSHDSLYFHVEDGPVKLALGRWFFPVALMVRGFATPWMIGVLSTIFVALAVVLVTRLLKFDRIKSFCVALLFSTNIALISLFGTYIYDGDVDCFALLMAVFAVYAFDTFSGKKKYVISVIALILCLASYQAYICVAVGLFLILLIYKAAACKDKQEVNKVLFMGLQEFIVLLVSAVIYVILMFVLAFVFQSGISTGYNGAGNVGKISFISLLRAIPEAYFFLAKRVIKPTAFNGPLIIALSLTLYVLICVTGIHYIKKNRNNPEPLKVIIPATVLMPLGVNAIYLVSNGTMHQLMYFAYCIMLLLPFVFTDLIDRAGNDNDNKADKRDAFSKRVCAIAVIAIAVIGFNNLVYANGAYAYKKLVYDNTLLHAQKIWEDVNSIEGYVEGETPVVFAGDFTQSKVGYKGELNEKYQDVLLGGFDTAITYEDSAHHYFNALIGRDMIFDHYDPEDASASYIKSMPSYPSAGYCELIDGKVVVKISDM